LEENKNHSVPSEETLRKYLQGELSAAEMHAVEKHLLTHDLLHEGMEGLEEVGAQAMMDDLAAIRAMLSQQEERRGGAFPWFKWMGLAASVLLVAVAIWWVTIPAKEALPETLSMEKQDLDEPLDMEETPSAPDSADFSDDEIPTDSPPTPALSTPPPAYKTPLAISKPGQKLEEEEPLIAFDFSLEVVPEESLPIAGAPAQVIAPAPTKEEVLRDRAAGLQAEKKKLDMAEPTKPSSTVSGRVTSLEDGTAIPGINVVVKGTSQGVMTDVEGTYRITLPEGKNTLVFSFIGMVTQEVAVGTRQVIDVQLAPDVSALSEVVVTGYGVSRTSPPESVRISARPKDGRASYRKYLRENTQYPLQAEAAKVSGTVTLEFTVYPGGLTGSYHIERGLGHGCDEEAIRLVQEGPAWLPAMLDGRAISETVRVKIRFPAK
jgi:TonB family protein